MITLAFAQMMYYVFVSLKAYGGDDGLAAGRSTGLASASRTTSSGTTWFVLVDSRSLLLHRLLPRASAA